MVHSCRVERDLPGCFILPDRPPGLCLKEIFVRFFFFYFKKYTYFRSCVSSIINLNDLTYEEKTFVFVGFVCVHRVNSVGTNKSNHRYGH